MVNKNKDTGFYYPSEAGPQGHIPKAMAQGEEQRIKTYKEFSGEGEYRKGSNKFGKLVQDIMMFLRLPEYNDHRNDNDGLKFKISDFEKKSNINIEEIKKLLNSQHKLISFDIILNDEYIVFKNFKNTKKNRFVWGESKINL